jgi:exodeoxyribonuclease-3
VSHAQVEWSTNHYHFGARERAEELRIVSWNILHGGGKRAGQIIDQLRKWQPDVVGLSEFRLTAPGRSIAAALEEMGLSQQHTTVDPERPTADGLLLASRREFERHQVDVLPVPERWIHVTLPSESPIHLVLLWVPNRDKLGTKYDFHDATVEALSHIADDDALALGDTNTGSPGIDEETSFFNEQEGQWFRNLADVGWHDVWRVQNPKTRKYTWHNHSSGRGFRIDQAFATNTAIERIRSIRYDWGCPARRQAAGTKRPRRDDRRIRLTGWDLVGGRNDP